MGQWVTVMGQKCDPLSGLGDRVIGQVVAMLGGGYLGERSDLHDCSITTCTI